MAALFELSLVNGLLSIIIGTSLFGIITVLVVRKLIVNNIIKQHERIGRLLFRVSASLLALLISLSYANEKIGYNKVVNSLEQESAIISSVYLKLGMHKSDGANLIRKGLIEYVQYTIDDNWKDAINNPYFSKMSATLVRVNIIARNLTEDTRLQKELKSEIISDIDMITKTMQVRFYSTRFSMPYLTYILAFGLIIVWCFFAVYNPDVISLAFLTLYNIFIAVVFYFVVMLGNPMIGPLKIKPAPFIILLEKGLDNIRY